MTLYSSLLLCLTLVGFFSLGSLDPTVTVLQAAFTQETPPRAENNGNSSWEGFSGDAIRPTQYGSASCDICLKLIRGAMEATGALRQDSPSYCNAFDPFVRCAQAYECRFSTGSREQVITDRCSVLIVKEQSCDECKKLLRDAELRYPNLDRDSLEYCVVMFVPFACVASKNCQVGDINKQSTARCKDKLQDCDDCSSRVDDAVRVAQTSGLHGVDQSCDKVEAAVNCLEENTCGSVPSILAGLASEKCPGVRTGTSAEAGALRVSALRPGSLTLTLAFPAIVVSSLLTVRLLT